MTILTWRPAQPGETPGQLTPELDAQHALTDADNGLAALLDLRAAVNARVVALDQLRARLLRGRP